MTTPKASATAARIQRLEAQLAQTQAHLRQERHKQQQQAQARRQQRLLASGHLVAQAGLEQVEPAVLLGLLLDGAGQLADLPTRQRWQRQGAAALATTPRVPQRLQPLQGVPETADVPAEVSHSAPPETGHPSGPPAR